MNTADIARTPNAADVADAVRRALAEDVGAGDVTAALTRADARARAAVTLRQDALVCGQAWFDETFRQLDPAIAVDWQCGEGQRATPGTVVCRLEGPARAILTGERTALNLLQTLSATATAAAAFVAAVAGTGATILDTRKTIPGLRAAQKYAVRCAGAENHRLGLYDAILIKENHIETFGSVAAAIAAARAAANTAADSMLVEIEVESLAEFREALAGGPDRIMLDDFDLGELRAAVALRDASSPSVRLEASGGVTLASVRELAATGVDYISVGSITKDIRAVDFSLRIVAPVR